MAIEEIEKPLPEKIDKEELIKNRLQDSVVKMYKQVMYSNGTLWTGYGSSVGFKVEGLGYYEPSLQRLLSLLHLQKDKLSAQEYIELIKESIEALREFDYIKEVRPEYHQEFLDSGAPERIKEVKEEFEKAVEDAEKMQSQE